MCSGNCRSAVLCNFPDVSLSRQHYNLAQARVVPTRVAEVT